MQLWHIWIIVGIILLIVEIFTPGFVIATFGIGCLFAAIPALLGLHVLWQILVFALTTFLAFVFVRPVYQKYLFPEQEQIPTNVEALIGQQALVIEEINNLKNTGRVKIGGEDWKAVSKTNTIIEKEKVVKITAVDGVKLVVEPL